MGTYYYSKVKTQLFVPSRVGDDLGLISDKLFGPVYRVERVEGVPTSDVDPRVAMWCFHHEAFKTDAAFSISLLRDGRFEFKVPRSSWDRWWSDQQKVRRRLVKLYNQVE